MGVQVSWGTLHHLSYLGVQARGAETMWSMIFIVKVKSSQTIEEKHWIHLKTYIWNLSSASNDQSICVQRSLKSVDSAYEETVVTICWTIMQTFTMFHLFSCPQILSIHFFFQLSQWDKCPPMFTLILSSFCPSRIPLWNHAIFVTVPDLHWQQFQA